MRTNRNSNTENPEQKKPPVEPYDRPDLRQPGMGVSHQPPMLLLRKAVTVRTHFVYLMSFTLRTHFVYLMIFTDHVTM